MIILSEWGEPEDYINNRGNRQEAKRCTNCGRVVDVSKIKR